MAIIKWKDPFQQIFPTYFLEEDWPARLTDLSSATGLNIYETDESVVVEASVPGVPEDLVEVTVEGNVLNISAAYEDTQEEKDKKKVVYRSNRQSTFSYTTSLPRMVDSAKAEAVVENGVVKVTIPKLEEERPKKITVKKKI